MGQARLFGLLWVKFSLREWRYISPMSPKAGLTTKVLIPTLRVVMHFVTLRVTQFCDSVRFRLDLSHLFAPRRPTLMGPK
ncbi:hypothetical protein AO073_14440 [Pseudomonas syringae ICMP 11293]|nr:hypothetical protein PSYRMG_01930 [Pseudomonas syringae UMAF0158]KTB92129.1 hypothetical protein AO073_14440 [Pseudomonas syringae ICMP 11293]